MAGNQVEIYDYIKKTEMVIRAERDYDSYRYIFKEYIDFLETKLRQDPSDIKAICQLAIMYYEDRRDLDVCLELMEDALKNYELSISKESLWELLNNLAYFYDAEYGDDKKTELALKRAIDLNSEYPNSYYALAYLTAEADPSFALDVIRRIPLKKDSPTQYRFLYGYILMRNSLFEDALKCFEDLSKCSDIETVEKSIYNCAIIYSIIGKVNNASMIAETLYRSYKEGKNEEISTFELIHLFYILKDYEKVVGLFDSEKTENIYVDVQTIKLYFYALMSLGLKAECEKVYQNKISEIKEEIDEIKVDSDMSDNEKMEFVIAYQKDLTTLSQYYFDIVFNNIAVNVDDYFYYSKNSKVCYLIDCPRHYVN
jgi:tetratricopeptide (TPR) repeat protein